MRPWRQGAGAGEVFPWAPDIGNGCGPWRGALGVARPEAPPTGGANPATPAAHATGVVIVEQGKSHPLCACGSLMAKWTYAFGAQLGPSHASRCLPSDFLPPKLSKLDAVLITPKPLPPSPAAPVAASKRSHRPIRPCHPPGLQPDSGDWPLLIAACPHVHRTTSSTTLPTPPRTPTRSKATPASAQQHPTTLHTIHIRTHSATYFQSPQSPRLPSTMGAAGPGPCMRPPPSPPEFGEIVVQGPWYPRC